MTECKTATLTKEQLQRELDHRAAMVIARKLRQEDLISEKELRRIAQKIDGTFSPIWSQSADK